IKGKFIEDNLGGTFQLLRSHKNASDQSKFVQVGKLAFAAIQPGEVADDKTKRLAVVTPSGYVPYLSINQLRSGSADTARAVYITDPGRFGLFRLDPADTSTPDDSAMVLVYSTKRFKRVTDYVTPEMFGAKGDGVADDTPYLKKAIKPGRKVILKGKYLVTNSIKVVLANSQSINISGVGDGEILFNGYFPCLEFTSSTDSGRVVIDNVRISGTMPFIGDDVRFAVGIQTNRIDAISITNSYFNKIYGNGIFLINTKGASKIIGNSFTNCGGLNPNRDGDLQDHYGDGINAWTNCKNMLISSNTIHFDATTIGYYGRCGIVFDYNSAGTIENNTVSGYSRGIHIENNKEGSSVYGNRVTGSACAIILSQSSYNRVSDNYFSSENSPNRPYIAGAYFVSSYGDNEKNVFANNKILVDVSLDTATHHIPQMTLFGSGKDYLFEKNTIDGSRIYLYGTSGYVFRNNVIKSTELTHTSSNTIFEFNKIDCKSYTDGASSSRFISNEILNSRAGEGVTRIFGYNSNSFALIDNKIYYPSSYLIGNDGSSFYGEISGNTIYTNDSSYVNFWAWFAPYFNRVPIFTRAKNIEIKNGVFNSTGFYYSGSYQENGVSVQWATASPSTGSWSVGDKIFNYAPTPGGYSGWICTTAGTPGTWKQFGKIEL
ncbi:right-handed parallel beta-helix repeat-containing protein, partial [Dyadobacter sp. LHD-138]|uniref:right-handed parallel beta-helix repeat-containing protein n=1 Tax=Dyadobacter sp. LHD-138 TaxID=3071413 RepID=UPI0027E0BB0E